MKFGTRLIHNGNEIDPSTGASSIPIYQASTFHQTDLETEPAFDYSRSGNPTRQAVEDAMAVLEGGVRAYAFASGMAAISATLMIFSAGDHLVAGEDLYGGTFRVLTNVLTRFGVETTFVDATDLQKIEDAVRPGVTRALILETPSNPTMKITNLRAAVEIAKRFDLLTVVDNTFMSPLLQRPLELGVDIVVHSATKFMGGHSDLLAGAVAARDPEVAARIKYMQNALGGVLAPHDAWLLLRGLRTLKVRLDAQQATALRVAKWLSEHKAVKKIYYPGLLGDDQDRVHFAQAEGPGAVLSFDVGSGEAARTLFSHVKLPLVAVSLGGVESILSYPVKMSHAAMPQEERLRRGITDGLIRLSVGLEDADDLLDDLSGALEAVANL